MLIILGKEIPENKNIHIALTCLKGIGISKAKDICKQLHIPLTCNTSDLTESQKYLIENFIQHNVTIEGNLNKILKKNVIKYIKNESIRGFRHRHGLPVRGQRTHSNGRTKKLRKFHYVVLKQKNIKSK